MFFKPKDFSGNEASPHWSMTFCFKKILHYVPSTGDLIRWSLRCRVSPTTGLGVDPWKVHPLHHFSRISLKEHPPASLYQPAENSRFHSWQIEALVSDQLPGEKGWERAYSKGRDREVQ